MHALSDFLKTRGLDAADGRPLYAYRISSTESEALRQRLISLLLPDAPAYSYSTAALFCLFGADHWRRSYVGGPWAWDTILKAVEAEHLGPGNTRYRLLQRLVTDGLRVLKRQLLKRTHREYLLTLGCEGGLPLQMILQEEASLRRYFRALFREYRANALNGRLPAGLRIKDLARHVSGDLPPSLREEVVYELSEQLLEKVLDHASRVPGAGDPVAALDLIDPAWREDMPLDLSDGVARALLTQLLADAGTVSARSANQIRFARRLERGARLRQSDTEDGRPVEPGAIARYEWHLTGQLEYPRLVSVDTMRGLFGVTEIPDRFDVSMREFPERNTPCARARARRYGKDVQITLTPILHGSGIRDTSLVAGPRALLLHGTNGKLLHTSDFPGALPLSDMPWVFSTPDGSEAPISDFRGEGSVDTRHESFIVVVDAGYTVTPGDERSTVFDIGVMSGDAVRPVWRIAGTANVHTPSGERFQFRTAALEESGSSAHYLIGRRPAVRYATPTMFSGFPQLQEERSDGRLVTVAARELQWRSLDSGARWTSDTSAAIGDGWLRRQVSGNSVFRARITVLPAAMTFQIRPDSATAGTVVLRGMDDADVAVEPAHGCVVEVQTSDRDAQIRVAADGRPPERIRLRLVWPLRGHTSVEVPLPLEHARFEDVRGRHAVETLRVAASQLPYFQASAMSPDARRTYHLHAVLEVTTLHESAPQAVPPVERPLRVVAEGLHALALGAIQQDIEYLLGSTTSLDARVALTIRADPPVLGSPVRMYATRYDLAFSMETWDTFRLDADDSPRLTGEELERLECRAISLLAPRQPSVSWTRIASNAWQPPDTMSSGPWLVSAWDGTWCRVRPRLYSAAGDTSAACTTALASAMIEPDQRARRHGLGRAIMRMTSDPTDGSWELIHQMLERCADFPASAFDAVNELVGHDDALAMAALCMTERGEQALGQLMDACATLPMHWGAVPLGSWQRSLGKWLSTQVEHLERVGLAREVVKDQLHALISERLVSAYLPWLAPVLDVECSAILERTPEPETIALNLPSFLPAQAGRIFACISELPVLPEPPVDTPSAKAINEYRLVLDEKLRLPQPIVVPLHKQWQHVRNCELVNAPVIAAVAAVTNLSLPLAAKLELKAIEAAHADWMHRLYTAAFRYGLAAGYQEHWTDEQGI
jgi:hypothetical protein